MIACSATGPSSPSSRSPSAKHSRIGPPEQAQRRGDPPAKRSAKASRRSSASWPGSQPPAQRRHLQTGFRLPDDGGGVRPLSRHFEAPPQPNLRHNGPTCPARCVSWQSTPSASPPWHNSGPSAAASSCPAVPSQPTSSRPVTSPKPPPASSPNSSEVNLPPRLRRQSLPGQQPQRGSRSLHA